MITASPPSTIESLGGFPQNSGAKSGSGAYLGGGKCGSTGLDSGDDYGVGATKGSSGKRFARIKKLVSHFMLEKVD
jgi:hypothetical protein